MLFYLINFDNRVKIKLITGCFMKRLKLVCLSIMICFGLFLFSACDKGEPVVNAQNISVSTTEVTLRLGEFQTIDVLITPDNATNKDFMVINVDVDVISVQYDKENMQFTICANDEIIDGKTNCTIGVKTTDGTNLQTQISVNITEREASVETPKNLIFDGSQLMWSEVNEAKGYIVNINGQNMPMIYTNSYQIDTVGEVITAKVQAVGETNSLNSAFTPEIVFEVLPAPQNITYTNNILQWSAIEGAVGYDIYFDGKIFHSNETQFSLLNRFEEAKVYQIKVQACGNLETTFDSKYSDALEITKLASPLNLKIENSIAVWDSVIGSTKYQVLVDEGKATEYVWTVDKVVGQTPQYKLPSTLTAGDHTISVKAVGNNKLILDSDLSVAVSFKKLSPINTLRIENGLVCWDRVLNATTYTLYINGEAKQTTDGEQTTYTLNDYGSGTYTFNIVVNGDGTNTIASDKYEKDLVATKLISPENLHITRENGKNVVKWDAVSGATGYILKITSGQEVTFETFDSTQTSYIIAQGEYAVGLHNFNIYAVGNNGGYNSVNYISSNYNKDDLVVEKLALPQNFKVENGILVWDKVNSLLNLGIKGYQILINGIDVVELESTFNNFDFAGKDYAAGNYTVCVKAVGSESSTIDGDYTEILTVSKLGEPRLYTAQGKVVDVTVENAEKVEYKITRADGTFTTYQISNLVGANNEVITITARALAPANTNYINGDYCEKLVVKQLPKITDLDIIDGIFRYGSETYINISSISFIITLLNKTTSETQIINNELITNYNLNILEPADYAISVMAKSELNGSTEFDSAGNPTVIPYLNSTISNVLQFKKLATPENFKVTSLADGGTTFNDFVQSLTALSRDLDGNMPGNIVWDTVDGATKYSIKVIEADREFEFIGNRATLQNQIGTGSYTIKIKAVGDGTNTLSSEYSQTISCIKTAGVSNLRIENGEIVWDGNLNSDLKDTFGMPLWLTDSSKNAKILVAVINGKSQVVLDMMALSQDILKITDLLQNPKVEIGETSEKVTLSLFVIPFNAYVSNLDISLNGLNTENCTIDYTDKMSLVSDYSNNSINLISFEAPTNLSLNKIGEDHVLSWSALQYTSGIKGYEITVKYNNETYKKVLDNIDTTKNENCQWIFNKENFESISEGQPYGTGVYSFAVRALAEVGATYTDDAGIVYYYKNGVSSISVSTTILENPTLAVQNGIIKWTEIQGASSYSLLIDGTKLISLENTTHEYILDETYSAGSHTFKIKAEGDGKKFISSYYSNEYTFIKLEQITGLSVINGVLQYNANDVVSTTTNYCTYAMLINGKEYTANKNTKFELDSRFAGGKSYEVFVYAKGDNEKYLSSDKGNKCLSNLTDGNLFKLETPTRLHLESGKLVWNEVENATAYRIYISGREEIIKETYGSSFSFDGIESGSYYIQVKALGNNYSYLNSDYTTKTTYTKMGNIEGFTAENGYITWTPITVTVDNNLIIAIKKSGETQFTEYNLTAEEMEACRYELDNRFEAGEYEIFMYNFGGEFGLTSDKTETKTFTKLASPSTIEIKTEDDGQFIEFNSILNANTYILKISADNEVKQIVIAGDVNKIKVESADSFEVDDENDVLKISSAKTYTLNIKTMGTGIYLNSNYSASKTITSPEKPVLTIVKTNGGEFAGEINWQEVENADYYIVSYTKDGVEYLETVYENRFFVDGNGEYRIKVKACQEANGFNSEYSDDTGTLVYGLFNGSGTLEDPYLISTANSLENIIYNMSAYYKLAGDIDMLDVSLKTIGSQQVPFTGQIDGANYSIKNLVVESATDYSGIISTLAEGGVIKNLTINLKINGGAVVGGIVGYNNGTIENCVVTGEVSSKYNNVNTILQNGGIAGINNSTGKIIRCVNHSIVAPSNTLNSTYAGGIAAENYGTIEKSGNNGIINANMAGGIAGYNYGIIKECYNNENAVITAETFKNNKEVPAYAGGIAGYSSSTNQISYCYNIGKVTANSAFNNLRAYAGGILGYNDGTIVNYCYSINGKSANEIYISTSAINSGDGYAGILVGYNKSGTITENNVYIYTAKNQTAVYNTVFNGTGLSYDVITTDTILNKLSKTYFSSGLLHPTLKNAKYI